MKKTLCVFLSAVIMIGLFTAFFNAYAYLDFDFADKGSIGDYEERPEYAYNDPKNGTNVTYSFDPVTGTLVMRHNPSVDPSGNMASYSTSPFAGKTAIKHLIVNEGVTGFCANAFSGCTGLLDVSLPGTMTGIAGGAFSDCTSLKSITLTGDVKSIGRYAFAGCVSLKEVKLNNGLEDIGQYAFYECGALEEITFPKSLTGIHASAFSNSGLKSIAFNDSKCVIFSDAFLNCAKLSDVKPGKYVTMNSYAFSYCTALKSIEIPGVNETISEKTFYNCTALEKVKINEGTKVIGEDAFNECTAVKVVEIPKSLVSVTAYAFWDCEALTDVYYKGTQTEWNKIEIGNRNDYLTNARIHFNSSAPGIEGCNGNHKWDAGKITKSATYKATGEKVYTCTVCKATKTETIAKRKAPTVGKVSGLKAARKIKTNAIKLAWNKATNADKYEVYRSTDGKKWTKLTTTTKLAYTDKAVKAGTKYQYKVRGIHTASKATGAYSSILKTQTLTAAPKISSLKSTKAKTATVKWGKVTGAKSYVIYKSKDGKKFTKAATTTKTTVTLKKLTAGKKVYVKIIAVNAYGKNSAYSAVKSVKVKK